MQKSTAASGIYCHLGDFYHLPPIKGTRKLHCKNLFLRKCWGHFKFSPFKTNLKSSSSFGSMFGEVNFSISGTSFWSCVCFAHRFSCDQPHPCRSSFPRVSNPSHPPATGWTNPRDSALKDCGKALWKVGNPSERQASKRKLQKTRFLTWGFLK